MTAEIGGHDRHRQRGDEVGERVGRAERQHLVEDDDLPGA